MEYRNICSHCSKRINPGNIIINVDDTSQSLKHNCHKHTQTDFNNNHIVTNRPTCIDDVFCVCDKVIISMLFIIVAFCVVFILWIFTGMIFEA